MSGGTDGNGARSRAAPLLAYSRASPYLLLLAPVAFVLVDKLASAYPTVGTILSIAFGLAVVLVVRNASRGAVTDTSGSVGDAFPEIDREQLGLTLAKLEEGLIGIGLLVLTIFIMKQMSWPSEPYTRLFTGIVRFFGIIIALALTFHFVLKKLLDDSPAVRHAVAIGAAALLLYQLSPLFSRLGSSSHSSNIADMRQAGDSPQQLERLGDRVYERDAEGNTMAHAAAKANDGKLLEMLVAKGLDVNARNNKGETPFFILVGNSSWTGNKLYVGRHEELIRLMEKGADPKARTATGRTVLHDIATQTSNDTLFRMFVDQGIDINASENQWGTTPFMLLVQRKAYVEYSKGNGVEIFDPSILTEMIEKGADVDARDKRGHPVIFYAMSAPTVFKILLDAGADPNVAGRNGDSLWWEMRYLKAQDIIAIADQIPEIRTPVQPDGKPGRDALLVFASYCEPALIEYFLKRGLDPHQQDEYGYTPLHHALGRHGDGGCAPDKVLRMTQLLVQAGANVNARTFTNHTPLMAATPQPPEVVSYLIAQGAEINALSKNPNGPDYTAVDWFRDEGNKAGVEALRRAGGKSGEELRTGSAQ